MRLKGYILIILALWISSTEAQYMPKMSLSLESSQFFNPASAGAKEYMSIFTGLRKQWAGLPGSPSTQMISIDAPLSKQHIGLGGVLYSDRIGATIHHGFIVNYAYRLDLEKGRLSFGLGGGLNSYKLDVTKLNLINDADHTFYQQFNRDVSPTANFGVVYTYSNLSAGVSINDFMIDNDYGVNLTSFIQYKYKLNAKWKLTASGMYRNNVLQTHQFDLATVSSYDDFIYAGLTIVSNGNLIGGLGIKPTNQFLIFYSYDYLSGNLRNFSSGSHEVMLKYDFVYKHQADSPRSF